MLNRAGPCMLTRSPACSPEACTSLLSLPCPAKACCPLTLPGTRLLSLPFRTCPCPAHHKPDVPALRFTNAGYRVQHNNTLGPFKGGVIYHPSVDLESMRRWVYGLHGWWRGGELAGLVRRWRGGPHG